MAAQIGGANVAEAWGEQGAHVYRMVWGYGMARMRGVYCKTRLNRTVLGGCVYSFRLDGAHVQTSTRSVMTAHGPPGGFRRLTGVRPQPKLDIPASPRLYSKSQTRPQPIDRWTACKQHDGLYSSPFDRLSISLATTVATAMYKQLPPSCVTNHPTLSRKSPLPPGSLDIYWLPACIYSGGLLVTFEPYKILHLVKQPSCSSRPLLRTII